MAVKSQRGQRGKAERRGKLAQARQWPNQQSIPLNLPATPGICELGWSVLSWDHCAVRRNPRSMGANFAQGNSETRQGLSQSSSSKAQATGTTSAGGAGDLCPAFGRFGTPWSELLWQAGTPSTDLVTHRSPSFKFSASCSPSNEWLLRQAHRLGKPRADWLLAGPLHFVALSH